MKQILLVFLGGGIGSCLRFLISKFSNQYFHSIVLGTFLVNMIGCLIIGIVLGFSIKNTYLSQNQALILTTGFCGGFTTFSAFSAENYAMFKAGEFIQLSAYTLASVLLGIVAVAIGFWFSKL